MKEGFLLLNSLLRIPAEDVRSVAKSLLINAGIEEQDAELVADILYTANLRGVDTHGIGMLPGYISRLRNGTMNPKGKATVLHETPVSAMLDGDNAIGHLIAYRAMSRAIVKAKESGIGMVVAKNSNHFGAASYYSMMAQKEGLIGACATNASAQMAPTGGCQALYGNNPWSIAFPYEEGEIPVVIDMANSVVASGKIRMAKEACKKIPLEWALDNEGQPTADPSKVKLIQPFGGYKGYALSFAVEALTSILADATVGKNVISSLKIPVGQKTGQQIAHTFFVIDVKLF